MGRKIKRKLISSKTQTEQCQVVMKFCWTSAYQVVSLYVPWHTRVTHSYLLLGEEQPQCVGCDAPFTVRHFLLECADFAQASMLIT